MCSSPPLECGQFTRGYTPSSYRLPRAPLLWVWLCAHLFSPRRNYVWLNFTDLVCVVTTTVSPCVQLSLSVLNMRFSRDHCLWFLHPFPPSSVRFPNIAGRSKIQKSHLSLGILKSHFLYFDQLLGLCIYHRLWKMEALLMRAERRTNLWVNWWLTRGHFNTKSVYQHSGRVSPRTCDPWPDSGAR